MRSSFFHGKERPVLGWIERNIGSQFDWSKLNIKILHNCLFKDGRYQPETFWNSITASICSPTRGRGGVTDQTETVNNWLSKEFERAETFQVGQISRFILTGRDAILDAFNEGRIDNDQKKQLGMVYRLLVENEAMKRGWEEVHDLYLKSIEAENSQIFRGLAEGLLNNRYGINGDVPLLVEDGGEHVFLVELNRFLDHVKTDNGVSASKKYKVIKEAQAKLIPVVKNTDPKIQSAAADAYLAVVDSLSDVYGEYQCNRLTAKYDSRPAPAKTDKNPEQTELLFVENEVPRIIKNIEDLLSDSVVGVGGTNERILDSSITLLRKISDAIESRNNPIIEGAFFSKVSERLLKLLKNPQTRHPRIAELYGEFTEERLIDGQNKLAEINTKPDRIKHTAQQLIDRITDPDYGIGSTEEVNLTEVFGKQFDRLMDVAERSTSEVTKRVFVAVQDKVKETIKNIRKESVVPEKLIRLVDKMFVKFGDKATESEMDKMFPIRLTDEECQIVEGLIEKSKLPEVENAEYLKQTSEASFILYKTFKEYLEAGIKEHGFDSPELRKTIFEQTKEQLVTQGIREEWNVFIEDMTDANYGAGAQVGDLSQHFITRFDLIRNRVERSSPEDQYYFYEVGKESLIAAIKDPDIRNKQVLIEQLDKLCQNNVLKNGKKFAVEVVRREAEKIDKSITEIKIKTIADFLKKEKNIPDFIPYFDKVIIEAIKASATKISGDGLVFEYDLEKALEMSKRLAYERNVNNAMRKYWDKILENEFDKSISIGTYAGIQTQIDREHQEFMEEIKTLDASYTIAFLRIGVDSIAEKLKSKDISADQRLILMRKALNLVVSSPVASEVISKNNRGEGGKYWHTLGIVHYDFIKHAVESYDFVRGLTAYISSREAGKIPDEIRLCLVALEYSRDEMMRRKVDTKQSENNMKLKIGDVEHNLGAPPSLEDLQRFERILQAGYESITKLLAENIDENAMMGTISTFAALSPWTAQRMGMLSDPKGTIKQARYLRNKTVEQIFQQIINSDLSPAEKSNVLFILTGKIGFDPESIRRYERNQDLRMALNEAVMTKDGKTNLFGIVFAYKEDIAQMSGQPAYSAVLSDKWTPESLPLRKFLYEKFIETVQLRICDNRFNDDKELAKKAAWELMALSMTLENTKGEDEAVKSDRAARIFSNLLIDILTGPNQYADELKYMAEEVLSNSLPYWAPERIQIFADQLYTRANIDGTWIEKGGWKSIVHNIAYVGKNVNPSEEEVRNRNIRTKAAKIMADITLKLLQGYTTLDGRNMIRSPFQVVTGKPLYWTKSHYEVPDDGINFIHQAIASISTFGTTDQKKELKEHLEHLARQEMLTFAIAKHNPGYSQGEYLSASRGLLKEMEEKTREAEEYLVQMFDRSKLSRPLIQVDANGRIIGLTKTALLDKLHEQEKEALKRLSRGLSKTINVIGEQRDEELKRIKIDFDWKPLVEEMRTYTNDLAGKAVKLDDVVAALEKFGKETHGVDKLLAAVRAKGEGKSSAKAVDMYIETGDVMSLLGLVISGLGQTPQAYTEVVKQLFESRTQATAFLEKFLADIHVTSDAAAKVGLKTILTETIATVLGGDKQHMATVIQAKAAVYQTYKQEIDTIETLLKQMQTDRSEVYSQASKDDVEQMKKELAELKAKAEAEYSRRSEIISNWAVTVKANGEEIARLQTEYASTVRQEITDFQATLKALTKGGREEKKGEYVKKEAPIVDFGPNISSEDPERWQKTAKIIKQVKGQLSEPVQDEKQQSEKSQAADPRVHHFESLSAAAVAFNSAIAMLGDGDDMTLNMQNMRIDVVEVFNALGFNEEYRVLLERAGLYIEIKDKDITVVRKRNIRRINRNL